MSVVEERPNSVAALRARADADRIGRWSPYLMLISRLLLFALWQALIAALFAARGSAAPWTASIAWWPLSAVLTNLVSIALMVRLARREGIRWRDLLNFQRGTARRDFLVALGIIILSIPAALLPNIALGAWLFGDALAAQALFLQPLPLWAAALTLVLFPLTIALAELPTYYAYAMPRLKALSHRPWTAVLLAAAFHSLQHVTLPLVFDWRFVAWRALMFALFALLVAVALHWRPRLLPYFMIFHGLIDLQVAWIIWTLSLAA